MKCARCGGKLRVSNTRSSESYDGQYLVESAKDLLAGTVENFVVRERHCTQCSWRARTIEVSYRDIRRLKNTKSKP